MQAESASTIMHALWSELTVVNDTLQPQCSPLNALLLVVVCPCRSVPLSYCALVVVCPCRSVPFSGSSVMDIHQHKVVLVYYHNCTKVNRCIFFSHAAFCGHYETSRLEFLGTGRLVIMLW